MQSAFKFCLCSISNYAYFITMSTLRAVGVEQVLRFRSKHFLGSHRKSEGSIELHEPGEKLNLPAASPLACPTFFRPRKSTLWQLAIKLRFKSACCH